MTYIEYGKGHNAPTDHVLVIVHRSVLKHHELIGTVPKHLHDQSTSQGSMPHAYHRPIVSQALFIINRSSVSIALSLALSLSCCLTHTRHTSLATGTRRISCQSMKPRWNVRIRGWFILPTRQSTLDSRLQGWRSIGCKVRGVSVARFEEKTYNGSSSSSMTIVAMIPLLAPELC
jgi:hypothetical protein